MNEIVQAIRALLLATLGNSYKKYYYGEVRVPNTSVLPFIEVIPLGTIIKNKGTGGMLQEEYRIQINIKNTLKKYLKQNTDVQVIEHVQDLVEKMEGRTNGDLDSDTVLGILHDNLQLGTAEIVGDWEISYGDIDLGDSYITLATVTFTVRKITY